MAVADAVSKHVPRGTDVCQSLGMSGRAASPLRLLVSLTLSLVVLDGCAPPDGDDDTAVASEQALRELPVGTYVAVSGPSGALGHPLRAMHSVRRLTLRSNRTFEADTTYEWIERVPNPLWPWLVSETTQSKPERVTGRFRHAEPARDDAARRPRLVLDGVGEFHVERRGARVVLVDTWLDRRTELEKDDGFVPRPDGPPRVRCTPRSPVDGAPTLEIEMGESISGRIRVKNPANDTRAFAAAMDTWIYEEPSGLRDVLDLHTARHNYPLVKLRFSRQRLHERAPGTYDVSGSVQNSESFGSYVSLSLRCENY